MNDLPGHPVDSHWIRAQRGEKMPVDPFVPYGYFNEQECTVTGSVEEVTTILLTNRECPYNCLMCDLWKHTTDKTVPPGAIPAQIEYALSRLPFASRVKLYNSGSFFDRRAIPLADYEQIASLLSPYKSVLVESHSALIGNETLNFKRLLKPALEVGIGLETIHPEVLPRLNKQMTTADFGHAVEWLRSQGILSRAYILLRPPFLTEEEGIEWACKSIDFAFGAGVSSCVVIPVRPGNGALDKLTEEGYFAKPAIRSLERVMEYGLGLHAGVVLADLWDLEQFADCVHCKGLRRERLNKMNLTQAITPPVDCSC